MISGEWVATVTLTASLILLGVWVSGRSRYRAKLIYGKEMGEMTVNETPDPERKPIYTSSEHDASGRVVALRVDYDGIRIEIDSRSVFPIRIVSRQLNGNLGISVKDRSEIQVTAFK